MDKCLGATCPPATQAFTSIGGKESVRDASTELILKIRLVV